MASKALEEIIIFLRISPLLPPVYSTVKFNLMKLTCTTANTWWLVPRKTVNNWIESQCFPWLCLGETLRFSGNKINCFPRDQSLNDLLYSKKRKTSNGNSNGSHRPTFAGNSALLPSDVIDFAMLPAQRLLAGNSFIGRCHVTSK